MVEDRDISELEVKLNNLFKHMPCRKIKLGKVNIEKADNGLSVVLVSYYVPVMKNNIQDWDIEMSMTVLKPGETFDIKSCVDKVKKSIPDYYKSIFVENVQSALTDVAYSFSEDKIPDTFEIVKIPFKQLAIRTVEDKPIFIDLCSSSYQKVLAVVDGKNYWSNKVDFKRFVDCMKRRELVTLLLTLSQTNLPDYNSKE